MSSLSFDKQTILLDIVQAEGVQVNHAALIHLLNFLDKLISISNGEPCKYSMRMTTQIRKLQQYYVDTLDLQANEKAMKKNKIFQEAVEQIQRAIQSLGHQDHREQGQEVDEMDLKKKILIGGHETKGSSAEQESHLRECLEEELVQLGQGMKQMALEFKVRIQEDEKIIEQIDQSQEHNMRSIEKGGTKVKNLMQDPALSYCQLISMVLLSLFLFFFTLVVTHLF